MFDTIMATRSVGVKYRITLKTLLSVGLIALSVLLPQIVHLSMGQPGGVQFLPMYLPVLLGGCLLGTRWALAVGVLSPLVSFAVTALTGNPMPVLVRLPFMMVELAVFALVAGLFSKLIVKNGLWAFSAVAIAQLCGRAVFLGLAAVFQNIVPFTPEMIWTQILTGWPGLLIQSVVVPLMVIGIRAIFLKDTKKK